MVRSALASILTCIRYAINLDLFCVCGCNLNPGGTKGSCRARDEEKQTEGREKKCSREAEKMLLREGKRER